MSTIILFNKPFGVLTQFTDSQFTNSGGRKTLKDYINIPDIYPAGRLDKDSEGLVLLTGDGQLQHRISHPKHKLEKTYWLQLEGVPDEPALSKLRKGIELKDGMTLPARARIIPEPDVWPRTPPIRYRANIPTSWIELIIKEGRNRQARRMTAAIGYPTLRLIRHAIGTWTLDNIRPGEWKEFEVINKGQSS